MAEQREDLALGIEGCNSSDIAHPLTSNHASLCMGLGCVSSKSFERELLCDQDNNKIKYYQNHIYEFLSVILNKHSNY
jgi:hypothetical protein